jgi:hypothetical protein
VGVGVPGAGTLVVDGAVAVVEPLGEAVVVVVVVRPAVRGSLLDTSCH